MHVDQLDRSGVELETQRNTALILSEASSLSLNLLQVKSTYSVNHLFLGKEQDWTSFHGLSLLKNVLALLFIIIEHFEKDIFPLSQSFLNFIREREEGIIDNLL